MRTLLILLFVATAQAGIVTYNYQGANYTIFAGVPTDRPPVPDLKAWFIFDDEILQSWTIDAGTGLLFSSVEKSIWDNQITPHEGLYPQRYQFSLSIVETGAIIQSWSFSALDPSYGDHGGGVTSTPSGDLAWIGGAFDTMSSQSTTAGVWSRWDSWTDAPEPSFIVLIGGVLLWIVRRGLIAPAPESHSSKQPHRLR